MQRSSLVAKPTIERAERDNPQASLVAHQDEVALELGQHREQRLTLLGESLFARAKNLGEPQAQAIHDNATLTGGVSAERLRQCQRLFDHGPAGRAARLVVGDPPAHLLISSERGRDVGDRTAARLGLLLGEPALARTHTTEDQFLHSAAP